MMTIIIILIILILLLLLLIIIIMIIIILLIIVILIVIILIIILIIIIKITLCISGVLKFLKDVGLSTYCDVFEPEHIDGVLLVAIDEDILISELGMRKLDARKLSLRIAEKNAIDKTGYDV